MLAPPPLDAQGVEIKVQHPEEPVKEPAKPAPPTKGGKKPEPEKKTLIKAPEVKGKPVAPPARKK